MKSEKISELTTNRLSVYLRCLNQLSAAGIKSISSQAFAKQFNLNDAQIRKDLAYFGEFGKRGVGYFVENLREHIIKILGLEVEHRVGIIGAGNLGTALAKYNGFIESGFNVVALFDNDKEKIGQQIGGNKIHIHDVKNIARVIECEKIDVVVIAVPAKAAQTVLNQAMSAGIKAIMNFAPARLRSRPDVKIKTVDLTISLESLSYFLARPKKGTSVTKSRRVISYKEKTQREERKF